MSTIQIMGVVVYSLDWLVHTTTVVVLLGLLLAGRVAATEEDDDLDKRAFSKKQI